MARLLVVGGAGGVGSALVRQRVAQGDEVIATVLDDAEAATVASAHGGAVRTHQLDLAQPDQVLESLRAVIAQSGKLDAVAVCAAVSPYGPAETTPLDVYRKTFDINVMSAVAIYQAAMPALRLSRGRIVFISSMAGKAAMPFVGAYVASKFALEGLADVMRREAEPQSVHISLVEPGGIRTPMMEDQLASIDGRIAGLGDEERQRYGVLYHAFKALSSHAHANDASTAEEVAAVVATALDADPPEPRYIVGGGAEQLIGMTKVLSDRELDGAFAQMFAPPGG